MVDVYVSKSCMARLDFTAKKAIIHHLRNYAGIAQLVEHNLAKVGVASSSLVSRSIFKIGLGGRVVMQRPAKPWTSVRFRSQPPES